MKKPTTNNQISIDAAEALKLISEASNKQLSVVANAALNATKLLATQAAEADKVKNVKGQDDHDFLLTFSSEVKTRLDSLKDDIKEIKEGTAAKIADHEIRINSLETEKTRTATLITVVGAILTVLVGLLVYHLFQQ